MPRMLVGEAMLSQLCIGHNSSDWWQNQHGLIQVRLESLKQNRLINRNVDAFRKF